MRINLIQTELVSNCFQDEQYDQNFEGLITQKKIQAKPLEEANVENF